MAVLGRTTQKPSDAEIKSGHAIHSPVEPSCRLNRPGWWAERHLAHVELSAFDGPLCEYSGTLPPDRRQELAALWETVNYG